MSYKRIGDNPLIDFPYKFHIIRFL